MKGFKYLLILLHLYNVSSEIRDKAIANRFVKFAKVRPVGAHVGKSFVPLTELPIPYMPHRQSGRRHLEDDCTKKTPGKEVYEGAKVAMFEEYYDDRGAKTVATVVIPDHIDRKHFEVTTQVPYLTLGPIEAIGYHPSTMKSEHPSECEKIYQDHLDELYSEESMNYSEESLEMARMPLFPEAGPSPEAQERLDRMYSDLDM